MKKLLTFLGYKTKYRIKAVKIGVRQRYQIQKSILGLVWDTVMNPVIVSPVSPYEYKYITDAENQKNKLENASV